MNIDVIINKLKKETNNVLDITYREKYINKKRIEIIYNESLSSSNNISDFIIRSLDIISEKNYKNILKEIENSIDNFKYNKIYTYKEICYYINFGFTIIIIDKEEYALALETKANLSRSISNPQTEITLRGSMDSFVENIQTNIGLIRRRIKSNDLWIDTNEIGKHTKTTINLIYINSICKKEYLQLIKKKLNKINIDGITNIGTIKNLIEEEEKSILPTIITTERPDKVSQALLSGKIVIMIDTSPFALIIPITLNDLFLSTEDSYSKGINVTVTRIIRYCAFYITLLTPAIYIAITTYNQEMLPTQLLTSIASQRANVPFPTIFEAIIMLTTFEILRECDLRLPTFTTSALSIVGALVLGEAAVNAGIVSPIMIIIISITEVSALLFTEPELISAIRWYRVIFMISANFLGIYGITCTLIYFITKLVSLDSFGLPYLYPFSPININSLKNSIIKFPIKYLRKRDTNLSNNINRYGSVKQ
ncbi:MAG: spore germination protein [Bacilli bacterium]|nr:spore germination protein [Bacilli bacterium]